uniref:60S ribosomal protein L6 n=1 Tax=Heterosigma akashiwo TaxID=2829 RepID=A0A6V1XE71_HETAK
MAKKQSKGGAKGPARAANVLLAKGIYAVSASTNARRKGQFKVATKGGPKKAAAPEAAGKAPRYYPADDVKTPLKRNFKPKSAKLRTAIVPGTVLILLSGRFRGKRVVFLKQLESGTLLVTGPYKVNGVPLRRVNQAYVIATSVTVDVSGVDVSGIEDAFFAKEAVEKAADEDKFFNPENQKVSPPSHTYR